MLRLGRGREQMARNAFSAKSRNHRDVRSGGAVLYPARERERSTAMKKKIYVTPFNVNLAFLRRSRLTVFRRTKEAEGNLYQTARYEYAAIWVSGFGTQVSSPKTTPIRLALLVNVVMWFISLRPSLSGTWGNQWVSQEKDLFSAILSVGSRFRFLDNKNNVLALLKLWTSLLGAGTASRNVRDGNPA